MNGPNGPSLVAGASPQSSARKRRIVLGVVSLIVAGIVVLVGVAIVFLRQGGTPTVAPTVTFADPVETTPGTFALSAKGITGGCSPNCPLGSFRVQLFDLLTTQLMCYSVPFVADTANPPWLCAVGEIKLGFTDANSDGKFDTADFFTIQGIVAGRDYRLALIWAASAEIIALADISK